MKNLLSLLPTKIVNFAAGKLASYQFHPTILQKVIDMYSRVYGITLDESAVKQQTEFKTFNEFFTRDVDFAKRKIDKSVSSVISPVDGKIISFGPIKENLFYQAKGINFSLEELVGEKNASLFVDGYQMSIYLSPSDFHRIYAPCDGEITNFSYFNGNLLPVNPTFLKIMPHLFCINERLLSLLKVSKPKNTTVGILKIGALVVGGIKAKYNLAGRLKNSQIGVPIKPTFPVKKATEIAHFELGSMVMLLFPKGVFLPLDLPMNSMLKIGQKVGSFTK